MIDYIRPIWTIRRTASGVDLSTGKFEVFSDEEENQWINPGYYWEAKKAANKLNGSYLASPAWNLRFKFDVVKWSYFEGKE